MSRASARTGGAGAGGRRGKNALEPEWEARFEPRSYGFRPGRSCQDAIQAIYWTLNGKHAKRQWVLDADLKAAFDKIDHAYLRGGGASPGGTPSWSPWQTPSAGKNPPPGPP